MAFLERVRLCILGLYYYKKENATLEEDFFVRTKDELVPVEVKANKNRSKSLRKLIDNESYSDIKWGIKLADSNVGIENGIYTFPYFCSFLIKRYLAKKRLKLNGCRIVQSVLIMRQLFIN